LHSHPGSQLIVRSLRSLDRKGRFQAIFRPRRIGPACELRYRCFHRPICSLSRVLFRGVWSCELLLGTHLDQETLEDSAGKLYSVVRYDCCRDPIPCEYAFPERFLSDSDVVLHNGTNSAHLENRSISTSSIWLSRLSDEVRTYRSPWYLWQLRHHFASRLHLIRLASHACLASSHVGSVRLCAYPASRIGLPDVLLSFSFLHGQLTERRGSPPAPFPVELSGRTSSMWRHPRFPLYVVNFCQLSARVGDYLFASISFLGQYCSDAVVTLVRLQG